MLDEFSSRWRTAYENGAIVLRAGGQLAWFLAGLWVGFLGVCLVGATAFGLAMPDAELVKSYVGLIAGAKTAAAPGSAPAQAMIAIQGHAMPLLAAVVIGVRLVLLTGLLFGVGMVSAAANLWREIRQWVGRAGF
jgi:hypothetical protein